MTAASASPRLVGQAVDQRGGHLGIAEHAGPFAEGYRPEYGARAQAPDPQHRRNAPGPRHAGRRSHAWRRHSCRLGRHCRAAANRTGGQGRVEDTECERSERNQGEGGGTQRGRRERAGRRITRKVTGFAPNSARIRVATRSCRFRATCWACCPTNLDVPTRCRPLLGKDSKMLFPAKTSDSAARRSRGRHEARARMRDDHAERLPSPDIGEVDTPSYSG